MASTDYVVFLYANYLGYSSYRLPARVWLCAGAGNVNVEARDVTAQLAEERNKHGDRVERPGLFANFSRSPLEFCGRSNGDDERWLESDIGHETREEQ